MKKRMMILAMGLTIGLSGMVACGTSAQNKADDEEVVQIPNPWTSHESLAEAVSASGIDIKLPEAIGSFDTVAYQTMNKDLLDAIYSTSADEFASQISIRKSVTGEDNSGDYNEYAVITTEKISDVEVTLKGDGEKVSAAVFNKDNEDYYIYANDGMSKDDMISLVSDIIDKN